MLFQCLIPSLVNIDIHQGVDPEFNNIILPINNDRDKVLFLVQNRHIALKAEITTRNFLGAFSAEIRVHANLIETLCGFSEPYH